MVNKIASLPAKADVLRKHVYAVHSSSPMTLKERICVNSLLLNAMKGGVSALQDERYYTIPVGDLCEDVYQNRNNRTQIRQTLNGLVQKTVEWDYITEYDKRDIGASTWLAGYSIRDGILRYSYSAEIVDKVLNPKIWARLNHSISRLMKAGHSQSLYEQCARFRDIGTTAQWSLKTFRGLMGIANRVSYQEFKSLNRCVIKPAVKEINSHTEIYIEPTFFKERGQVASLQFSVTANPNYSGPSIPGVMPMSAGFDSEMLDERSQTYERLLMFGIEHSTAVTILETHDDAYIQDNLSVVATRIRQRDNEISNVAGYVIKAMQSDFRVKTSPSEVQAALDFGTAKERTAREKKEKSDKAQAKLDEFETADLPLWRSNHWLETATDDEREVAWQSFTDEAMSENAFIRGKLRDDPDSAWIMGLWRKWIRDNRLDPVTEADREACAHALDIDLNRHRSLAEPNIK